MQEPTLVASRRFSLVDQERFAALSGDWNPLHVDVIAARRTMFGTPLVHGVHLLCWALEQGLEAGPLRSLSEVRAAFRRPVQLEQELVLERSSEGRLLVRHGSETLVEVTVALGRGPRSSPAPRSAAFDARENALELERASMAEQSGALELALHPALAQALFPRLSTLLPGSTLAELLACTRLVGMRCPGLHSLFAGLHLKQREATNESPPELGFRVQRANMKYSSVLLAVRGPTLEGTLETFARPAPRPPLAMAEVKARVAAGEFAGRRALVLGGSRGLGEAVAKAIAAGGGRVVITYHRGSAEAERVQRDIIDAGGECALLQFDVTGSGALRERWPVSFVPNQLFYLATPFIRLERSKAFDVAQFEELARYYVTGLARAIESCRSLSDELLSVWAPSTIYLDKPERGTAPYAAAKAAMEELARQMSGPSLRIVTPRLPRLSTDQTASLTPELNVDPLTIALEHLRLIS